MKLRYLILSLFMFFGFSTTEILSQNIFQEVKIVEVHLDSTFWTNYSSVVGFSYSSGNFWILTHWGYVIKIDTIGTILDTIKINQSIFYRINPAISFDSDTIWVAGDNDIGGNEPQVGILAIDTLGNELGVTIPLPNFSRTVGPTHALIKNGDYFWVYDNNASVIYKIDRNGKVIKQFPNAWYGYKCPNIALLNAEIYKIGDGRSPYNTWFDVFTIDIETGYITNDWGWGGENNPWPIGLSAGENSLWSLQSEWEGKGIKLTFHKFDIPASVPLPEIPTTQWGDFEIVDWSYCPIRPPSIEGLHGLGYDKINHTIWFGYGHSTFMSSEYNNNRILPIIKNWVGADITNFSEYWTNSFKIYYDIYAHNDSIWVTHKWAGLYTGHVTLFRCLNDSLEILQDWDIHMDDVSGIAYDGKFFYVSGRDTSYTTGDLSNDIRKFDLNGQLVSHFQYPDSSVYNLEDLTWYQNSLWSISRYRNPNFLNDGIIEKVDILNISPNTGSIIKSYQTGWYAPDANLRANLASDGTSLITIGTVSSGIWDNWENTHIRILKLKLKPTSVDNLPNKIPSSFHLYPNFPNPFNPETTIIYDLPQNITVNISIFNVLGQLVKVLENEFKTAGTYSTKWDGKDEYGQSLPSGVYLFQIKAGNYLKVNKLMLLR